MDGRELRGDARTVLRRGSVAWQAGRLVAPAGSGRFLARSGLRREVAA